jgi:hypothetical protein
MKRTRKFNIILSIAGLGAAAMLLVYYLMRDDLWKKEVHIGFAGIFVLLGWRLWRALKQDASNE